MIHQYRADARMQDGTMKTTTTTSVPTRAIAAFLSLIALTSNVQAAPEFRMPDDYRLVTSVAKFDDTHQFAGAWRLRAPRALRVHHLELAVGTLSAADDTEAFVSLGPVWRLPFRDGSTFVEFGLSPTILSGSQFDGRELGGNFHFTSSLAAGMRFGRTQKYSLGLRAQHISNGGIDTTNPGLDMIGLTFSVEFRD